MPNSRNETTEAQRDQEIFTLEIWLWKEGSNRPSNMSGTVVWKED